VNISSKFLVKTQGLVGRSLTYEERDVFPWIALHYHGSVVIAVDTMDGVGVSCRLLLKKSTGY